MSGHKVVAINAFWASTISLILGTGILGGLGWVVSEAIAVDRLQTQIAPLVEAKIPEQLATLQSQLASIREGQSHNTQQIDFLVNRTIRTYHGKPSSDD